MKLDDPLIQACGLGDVESGLDFVLPVSQHKLDSKERFDAIDMLSEQELIDEAMDDDSDLRPAWITAPVAEFGDPFMLCARKETLFDSPLAFHAYETEPEVTMLAMSVACI